MSVNIMIADEYTIIRRGVISIINSLKTSIINMENLDVNVVSETDNQSELVNQLSLQPIDLLFLGFGLKTTKSNNPVSELDGITLIKWIAKRFPATRIVALSPYRNTHIIRLALESGAKGYISRNTCERTLWRSMTAVLNDEVYIERGLTETLFRRDAYNAQELTTREADVLRLLCRGYSLTIISSRMNISIKTVSAHKHKAMEKLGVSNDCQLYCLLSQTRMFDIEM